MSRWHWRYGGGVIMLLVSCNIVSYSGNKNNNIHSVVKECEQIIPVHRWRVLFHPHIFIMMWKIAERKTYILARTGNNLTFLLEQLFTVYVHFLIHVLSLLPLQLFVINSLQTLKLQLLWACLNLALKLNFSIAYPPRMVQLHRSISSVEEDYTTGNVFLDRIRFDPEVLKSTLS